MIRDVAPSQPDKSSQSRKPTLLMVLHALWVSKILVWTLVIFSIGITGYVLLTALGFTSSELVSSVNDSGAQVYREIPVNPWAGPMANVLLTLATLGAVSIVYEIVNYQVRNDEIAEAIKQAGSGLGEKITNDVLHLLVSDRSFIQTGLFARQREELLKCLILSNLDDDANDLATITAAQISGEERLRDFSVNYVAKNSLAEVLISYQTNCRPDSFEIRFWAIPVGVRKQLVKEPNVGQFYYTTESSENSTQILEKFKIEEVVINGKAVSVTVCDEDINYSKKYCAELSDIEDDTRYAVSYTMIWPQPSLGDVFHFNPSLMCRGMIVLRDFSESSLVARLTQPNSSATWESINTSAVSNPTKIGVRTSDWILPNASCGFVFLPGSET